MVNDLCKLKMKEKVHAYFGKITSTKFPFLCKARDNPVTYEAKDPTETTGAISVEMWTMWKPFLYVE